jgi:hypothetical protein
MQDAQLQVNVRCIEIIKEIAASGHCLATSEFVVQILLQRFGVSDFRDLNIGNIRDIPVLLLLADVHQKVRVRVRC